MKLSDFFRDGSLGTKINGFPYPVKYCPHCERPCDMIDAIHLASEQAHYKALYICKNELCPAYDYPAKTAYARIYYSSTEAYRALENSARLTYERDKKVDGVLIPGRGVLSGVNR